MKKRFLAALTALALCLSLLSPAAFAAADPVGLAWKAGAVSEQGEFDVTLTADSNGGVVVLQLTLDRAGLRYTQVTNQVPAATLSNFSSAVDTESTDLSKPVRLVWSGTAANYTGSDLAVLHFKAPEKGVYSLSMSGVTAGKYENGTGKLTAAAPAALRVVYGTLTDAVAALPELVVYNGGNAVEPALTVTLGSTALTEGTDYTVRYENNTAAAAANGTTGPYAVLTGAGLFDGQSQNIPFTISAAANTVTLDCDDLEYGNAPDPQASASGSGTITYEYKKSSEEDTAYTATVPSAVGSYVVRATVAATAEYAAASNTAAFKITAKPLTEEMVGSIADQTYTGAALTPALTVQDGETALADGTDYTVLYNANEEVGQATAQVSGQGNYSGSISRTFNIVKADNSLSGLACADVEYGQTPAPTASADYGTVTYAYKAAGAEDSAYSETVPTAAGRYTVRATAAGGDNYADAVGTVDFSITPRSIADAAIAGIADQTFRGTGIQVEPEVTLDGQPLTANTDYDISYDANVDVGDAAVTVTGKGNYQDTASASFRIVAAAPQTEGSVTAEYGTANKNLPTSGLTAKGVDGAVLKGSWTVADSADDTVLAVGNTEKVRFTFTPVSTNYKAVDYEVQPTISARSLSGAALTLSATSFTYNAQLLQPSVTELKLGDTVLTVGTDYTVSLPASTAAGTYTVMVTGRGNYTGQVSGDYTVNQAEPALPALPTLTKTILLSSVAKLSDVALPEVSGGKWAWTQPDSALPTSSETREYDLDFIPADTHNYKTVTAGKVSVVFLKVDDITTLAAANSKKDTCEFTSTTQAALTLTMNAPAGATITYTSIDSKVATAALSGNTLTITPKNVGVTSILQTVAYNGGSAVNSTLTVRVQGTEKPSAASVANSANQLSAQENAENNAVITPSAKQFYAADFAQAMQSAINGGANDASVNAANASLTDPALKMLTEGAADRSGGTLVKVSCDAVLAGTDLNQVWMAAGFVADSVPVKLEAAVAVLDGKVVITPKLLLNGTARQIGAPIVLTVKVPDSYSFNSKDVLLHRADGLEEYINFTFDAAQRTITFRANSFSTFTITQKPQSSSSAAATPTPTPAPEQSGESAPAVTTDPYQDYWLRVYGAITNASGTTTIATDMSGAGYLPGYVLGALQGTDLTLKLTDNGTTYMVPAASLKGMDCGLNYTLPNLMAYVNAHSTGTGTGSGSASAAPTPAPSPSPAPQATASPAPAPTPAATQQPSVETQTQPSNSGWARTAMIVAIIILVVAAIAFIVIKVFGLL